MRFEQKCSACEASILVLDLPEDHAADPKVLPRAVRAAGWRFNGVAVCSDCPDPAPVADEAPAPAPVTTKKRGK